MSAFVKKKSTPPVTDSHPVFVATKDRVEPLFEALSTTHVTPPMILLPARADGAAVYAYRLRHDASHVRALFVWIVGALVAVCVSYLFACAVYATILISSRIFIQAIIGALASGSWFVHMIYHMYTKDLSHCLRVIVIDTRFCRIVDFVLDMANGCLIYWSKNSFVESQIVRTSRVFTSASSKSFKGVYVAFRGHRYWLAVTTDAAGCDRATEALTGVAVPRVTSEEPIEAGEDHHLSRTAEELTPEMLVTPQQLDWIVQCSRVLPSKDSHPRSWERLQKP